MFYVQKSGQGFEETSLVLYAALAGQFNQILNIEPVRIEGPASPVSTGQPITWVYSTYGFVKGLNPDYDDFVISRWGMVEEPTGYGHHTYRFDGQLYVEQNSSPD